MIRFRQKIFFLGAAVNAAMVGSSVIGIGQGKKANRIAEEQGEQAAREQARNNREMEKIARQQAEDQARALRKIARNQSQGNVMPMPQTMEMMGNFAGPAPMNPGPLDYPQQAQYSEKSFANPSFLNKLGQTVYDVGASLRHGPAGKTMNGNIGTGKWLRQGMLTAGTFIATPYVVDKFIQHDMKKSGLPEPTRRELDEKEKKKKKNKAILAGLGTATAIAGGVAAKKGTLGTSWKKWADNNLTKNALKNRVKSAPGKWKEAAKNEFIKSEKEGGGFKWGSLVMPVGIGVLSAVPTITSYKAEKQAYKDQIKEQQNTYSDTDEKKPNKKRNLLLGTAVAAGTFAAGRRGYLGSGLQKFNNNIWARTGKVLKNNKMIKSGAEGWAEGRAKEVSKANLIKKNGKDSYGFLGPSKEEINNNISNLTNKKGINIKEAAAENYRNKILSRDSKATDVIKHPLRSVLNGANKFVRFEFKGNRDYAGELSKGLKDQAAKSGNEWTNKTADFLGKHKNVALVGSLGVGSLMFKPWEWGDKAWRGGLKAVDKNAFKYEERQQENVE